MACPWRRQTIIWTNAGIVLIGPLETNFSEILIKHKTVHSQKFIGKYRLRNGDHFAQGGWVKCDAHWRQPLAHVQCRTSDPNVACMHLWLAMCLKFKSFEFYKGFVDHSIGIWLIGMRHIPEFSGQFLKFQPVTPSEPRLGAVSAAACFYTYVTRCLFLWDHSCQSAMARSLLSGHESQQHFLSWGRARDKIVRTCVMCTHAHPCFMQPVWVVISQLRCHVTDNLRDHKLGVITFVFRV